jgi:hypothetical protein
MELLIIKNWGSAGAGGDAWLAKNSRNSGFDQPFSGLFWGLPKRDFVGSVEDVRISDFLA